MYRTVQNVDPKFAKIAAKNARKRVREGLVTVETADKLADYAYLAGVRKMNKHDIMVLDFIDTRGITDPDVISHWTGLKKSKVNSALKRLQKAKLVKDNGKK